MQISVVNSKGGCGKTTITSAIANVICADIVEHDLQATIENSNKITGHHTPTLIEIAKKTRDT